MDKSLERTKDKIWNVITNETFGDLHLLSVDRRHGGHVLGLCAKSIRASLHTANDLHLVLPENAAFLHADIKGDSAAVLPKAEGADGK